MNQRNTAASVRAKLLQKARDEKRDFTFVLTRYALERLLYRLGISVHAENFLLKGALLFDLWFDAPFRPTRDIDLLGFGSGEDSFLTTAFTDLCKLPVEDGMMFDAASVRTTEIRKASNYTGTRLTLTGWLDGARCPVQVDVAFGDTITAAPETVDYPVLLAEFPPPRLRVYPKLTVIAEKLETMGALGIANSRMKDFFDLWVLAEHGEYDGRELTRAIDATFARRRTPVPPGLPFALTDDFAADRQKQAQWMAFLGKNRLDAVSLNDLVLDLRRFLLPPLNALAQGQTFTSNWSQATGWH